MMEDEGTAQGILPGLAETPTRNGHGKGAPNGGTGKWSQRHSITRIRHFQKAVDGLSCRNMRGAQCQMLAHRLRRRAPGAESSEKGQGNDPSPNHVHGTPPSGTSLTVRLQFGQPSAEQNRPVLPCRSASPPSPLGCHPRRDHPESGG